MEKLKINYDDKHIKRNIYILIKNIKYIRIKEREDKVDKYLKEVMGFSKAMKKTIEYDVYDIYEDFDCEIKVALQELIALADSYTLAVKYLNTENDNGMKYKKKMKDMMLDKVDALMNIFE